MMVQKKGFSGGMLALAIALLLFAGGLDYATGPRVSIFPLYLLTVCVTAWFCGRTAGCLMAAACAITWLLTNLANGELASDGVVFYWNGVAGLLALVVVAFLVHARRELGRKIEEMVEEKTIALTAEISERKRAEEAVHRLAAQLSEAEDVQRRRLAHDIHDTLGQTLAVVKMNLEATVNGSAGDGRSGDAWQVCRVRESLSLIETMIRQTRTMTFELYPAMLDDLGLVATVRRYAEQLERQTGVQTAVSEKGESRKLPAHTANYLFRAIKELINNAIKHGQSRDVLITVYWREQEVRVVVDDDGCGFDVAAVLSPPSYRGLGLASIKERLLSLGGKTHIESSVGKGTRVIMELPVETTPDVAQGSTR